MHMIRSLWGYGTLQDISCHTKSIAWCRRQISVLDRQPVRVIIVSRSQTLFWKERGSGNFHFMIYSKTSNMLLKLWYYHSCDRVLCCDYTAFFWIFASTTSAKCRAFFVPNSICAPLSTWVRLRSCSTCLARSCTLQRWAIKSKRWLTVRMRITYLRMDMAIAIHIVVTSIPEVQQALLILPGPSPSLCGLPVISHCHFLIPLT